MIEINGQSIGPDFKPYIIAEVGINARDDLELAKRFIEIAAECGADAVKFQTHIADAEMSELAMREIGAEDVYETVENSEWSKKEHELLQSCARENGITFLSTPFSVEGITILDEIDIPAVKIGSGELTNREILERASETGKPLLVSTGMHTSEEIERAATFLSSLGNQFVLLYCVSEYPTSASDFDFGTIGALQDIADVPIGFSDHSVGVEAAKVAIANGAILVEKHFTIDRSLPGPDQEVSIEPDSLSELCSFAELYHETSSTKAGIQGEEAEIKQWARHSIAAAEDIEQGEELTRENTTTKRPLTGIPAERYHDVLGKRTATEIKAGMILSSDDLSN